MIFTDEDPEYAAILSQWVATGRPWRTRLEGEVYQIQQDNDEVTFIQLPRIPAKDCFGTELSNIHEYHGPELKICGADLL